MKKLLTILFILLSFVVNAQKGSFIDIRDNKTYKTITIGSQTWMAEDLKYNDTIFYNYQSEKKNDTLKLVVSCPQGWHIPSVTEWNQLLNTIGKPTATEKLQEKGGFNCLLNGRYNADIKSVENKGTHAYYWTSTERDQYTTWTIFVYKFAPTTSKIDGDKKFGYSIRCIKD